MKKIIDRLKHLTFTNIIFILLGLLSVLILINILFFNNNAAPTNTTNVVVTNPDATGYQVRTDNFGALENILPYDQDNYSLTKETINGKDVINITYDQTDSTALPGAYLYLQQYGLIEGDPRLIATPRGHLDLF